MILLLHHVIIKFLGLMINPQCNILMSKHPRKKQKTSKEVKKVQPLGINLLTDDANKDDEERRLESLLFGTKFIPKEKDTFLTVTGSGDDEGGGLDEGGREMNNLMDTDVS